MIFVRSYDGLIPPTGRSRWQWRIVDMNRGNNSLLGTLSSARSDESVIAAPSTHLLSGVQIASRTSVSLR